MMVRQRTLCASGQSGVGLLEVLVALLVLAIGALGYAGLQLTALRNSEDAHHRAHAAMIAQDAIERIKSNPAQAGYYATAGNWPASAANSEGAPAGWKDCMSSECDAGTMAEWDIKQLVWTASSAMPGGQIKVEPCGFNSLDCVIVAWNDQEIDQCIGDDGINSEFDSECLVMEIVR